MEDLCSLYNLLFLTRSRTDTPLDGWLVRVESAGGVEPVCIVADVESLGRVLARLLD